MVQQHVEPRPGTEPLQMSSLAAPGFRDQMLTNLRRNFIIYNRAPEYSEWTVAPSADQPCMLAAQKGSGASFHLPVDCLRPCPAEAPQGHNQ